MEAKDFILLLAIPVLLVGIIALIQNPSVSGAQTAQVKDYNILGKYSVYPNFKARMDFGIDMEFSSIKEKLNQTVDECMIQADIEKCFDNKAKELGWKCSGLQNEANDILHDFIDKINECISLEDDGIVCKFSLDEREIKNTNNKKFDILLTNENKKTRIEIIHPFGNFAEHINIYNLSYTNFDLRDTLSERLNPVKIIVDYSIKSPIVSDVFGTDDNSNRIPLSRDMIFYKKNGELKFVEYTGDSFKTLAIINVPAAKSYKFCANTNKEIYAFDGIGGYKKRNITFNFAIKYPKQAIPPKPIENLQVFDAVKSENAVILEFDIPEDEVKSFNIYYSTNDFIGKKTDEIKYDSLIFKKNALNDAEQIEGINLKVCSLDDIGNPCKYEIYNKALEPGKVYFVKSKNKLVYLLKDANIKDGVNFNFAVSSANELGKEIENDKSIPNNLYVFKADVNYKIGKSIDELAPSKVNNLASNPDNGKIKLTWQKPAVNIDGSPSTDIDSFSIYFKTFSASPTPEKIDDSYTKTSASVLQANCEGLVKQNCEFSIQGLQAGQIYSFAVVALDQNLNGYADNAEIMQGSLS